MRFFLTIIALSGAYISFGQPTGDITKDTSRANALFEQAIVLEEEDKQIVKLLQEAIELYEKHPFEKKQIEIKSHLAFAMYNAYEDSLSEVYAHEAINLAKKHLKDDLQNEFFTLEQSNSQPTKTINNVSF